MFSEDFVFSMMIIVPVYVLINAVLAAKMNEAAKMKGHGNVAVLCFLLGPASYFYVVALPDLKFREQNEEIIKALKQINVSGNSVPKYSNNDLPDL